MPEIVNPLRRLELPRRWELLAERARQAEVDPSEVVERVDDAAKRVDALLRRVHDGGGGVIEVIHGLSGSGKTTFLQTLPRFFDGVRVAAFPRETLLRELPEFIRRSHVGEDPRGRVILIDRRDNPTADDLSRVEEVFGELLNVFREPTGAAVVLWPITNDESARKVSTTAWAVGRDSMADSKSNGQFEFKGISPNRYWDLADNKPHSYGGWTGVVAPE